MVTFVPAINGIKIIPVHLNIVFSSEYFSFYSNLDEKKFLSIINDLNNDEIYIFDFYNIRNTLVSDAIASGVAGLLDKKVLVVNLKESTYKTFLGYFNEKLLNFQSKYLGKCLKTKNFPKNKKLPDLHNFNYLYEYLEKKCKEIIPKGNKLNYISSNVFINKHFDSRSLFYNIDTIKIAVYLMAAYLKEWEVKNNIDGYKLITSSFNGCILANSLALIIGREHISIPHLGPEFTKEDNRYIDYIKKGDKFVYIYDFIALGNEQKTISVIARLLNAEIVLSLGLAFYKPSEKENKKTDSLVDFMKIINNDIHITADKKDLIKLLGVKR